MTQKRDHQMIGLAGEFLTAGQLFKRGYQVSLTLGNAKAIDLFVFNPATKRTFKVQVKTQHRKNCFPTRKESIEPDAIYVFVRLNDIGKNEEFFILPGTVILSDTGKFWGSSYSKPGKSSSMPAINYGPLTPYKDNWQVFDR